MRTKRFLGSIAGFALAIFAPGAYAATAGEGSTRIEAPQARTTVEARTSSSLPPRTLLLAQAESRVSNAPQVFLFKGLADIFSSGMDTLGAKLRARGIPAIVVNHSAHTALADEVIQRHRAGGRGPVVIVGHSLGADATIYMSERLAAAKVPVALIVGFGTTMSLDVPANVARAVNYHQGGMRWRGPRVVNANLDSARDINHFNIEKIDRLQNETVGRVLSAIGGTRRPTATMQSATGEASAIR